MQLSSVVGTMAFVAFVMVSARGAGMARVQIDEAGAAKQSAHSVNHPSAGWVLYHHGACGVISTEEYIDYAHTQTDCQAACEEHGHCEAISYSSAERRCQLHHGDVDPQTMPHDPYLCFTRTATTATTTTTCVADCGVNSGMWDVFLQVGLTNQQIEQLCKHDGVWYWNGETTAVGAGARNDVCPSHEDTAVFCAGNDNTFGNRQKQGRALVEALDAEGVHPEAPENAHSGSITPCGPVTTTSTTTTTQDPGCTDHGGVASDSMVLDFEKAKVTSNNLGGMGPNEGDPEELRYQAIARLSDGRDVDLVVTTESPYTRVKSAMNGKGKKGLGKINLENGQGVELKFRFESTLTGHPVAVPAFMFSVADLDEGENGNGRETLMIDGFEQYYLTADTEVQVWRMGDGRTTFSSSTRGYGTDNPRDASKLTMQQANRMVTLLFAEGHEEFHLTLQVGKAARGGRFFYFDGRSAVLECGRPLTTTTATTTAAPPPTCHTHDVSMNLNFFGSATPTAHLDFEHGQEMVFENVGRTADGNHVNMVVKALSPYKPHNMDLEHVWWKGSFGLINLQAQQEDNHVDLSFTFRNPATDEQVTLEHLDLSFLDLDGGRTSARETITIGGFQSYYVSANSEVSAEPLADGRWRFGSTTFGVRDDNPDDPHHLTTKQANRAVNLVFADVSEILLTLTVETSNWVYGRDFIMAGTSGVKDPNCGVKHVV